MRRAHSGLLHAAVAFLIFTAACGPKPDQELARRISAVAETSDVSVVNVSALATFAWDRLFIFPPYTTSSQVEKDLGFAWSGSARIESLDYFVLLVFVDRGRVVRFVEQPRGQGDFTSCHRPGGYARTEAIFRCSKDATGWRRCAPGAG